MTSVMDERTEYEVRGWQLNQYAALGYTAAESVELLDDQVDWHRLDDLIRRGCSLPLAKEIAS